MAWFAAPAGSSLATASKFCEPSDELVPRLVLYPFVEFEATNVFTTGFFSPTPSFLEGSNITATAVFEEL